MNVSSTLVAMAPGSYGRDGGWIDHVMGPWVLIALVAAMVLFIVAWHRHQDQPGDREEERDG